MPGALTVQPGNRASIDAAILAMLRASIDGMLVSDLVLALGRLLPPEQRALGRSFDRYNVCVALERLRDRGLVESEITRRAITNGGHYSHRRAAVYHATDATPRSDA